MTETEAAVMVGRSAFVTTVYLKLLLSLTRLLWIIWMLLSIAALKVCSEVKSQVLHWSEFNNQSTISQPIYLQFET